MKREYALKYLLLRRLESVEKSALADEIGGSLHVEFRAAQFALTWQGGGKKRELIVPGGELSFYERGDRVFTASTNVNAAEEKNAAKADQILGMLFSLSGAKLAWALAKTPASSTRISADGLALTTLVVLGVAAYAYPATVRSAEASLAATYVAAGWGFHFMERRKFTPLPVATFGLLSGMFAGLQTSSSVTLALLSLAWSGVACDLLPRRMTDAKRITWTLLAAMGLGTARVLSGGKSGLNFFPGVESFALEKGIALALIVPPALYFWVMNTHWRIAPLFFVVAGVIAVAGLATPALFSPLFAAVAFALTLLIALRRPSLARPA